MLLLLLDAARRPLTVAELHRGMQRHGFTVNGRPGKVISDALRTEVANARVRRTGRGTYVARAVTRQRRSRMRLRMQRVASEAVLSQTAAT